MKDYLDFTVDEERFSELYDLVDDIHDNGQYYVMIVVSMLCMIT